jgi:hypothetical protein
VLSGFSKQRIKQLSGSATTGSAIAIVNERRCGNQQNGQRLPDHQPESDTGYDVLIFDNQNRGEEAAYWKEKFLNLSPQKNEFHQTQHFLTLTKQFITQQLEGEFETPKNEQIELLDKVH